MNVNKKEISFSYGEESYQINGRLLFCGSDVALVFTGGTDPHIGAVSLAVYEPERQSATVSTVTVYGHRDDELSSYCSKRASACLKCTAAASVGIHLDHADKTDLDLIRNNFKCCLDKLLSEAEKMM